MRVWPMFSNLSSVVRQMTKSFKATFVDYGQIGATDREVIQLIFEIPLSEQYAAVRALKKRRVQVEITPLGKHPMDYPAQVMEKCRDLKFQLWMSAETDIGRECKGNCAEAIRQWCGVAVRVDIVPGTLAGARWEELLNMYHARLEGKWK